MIIRIAGEGQFKVPSSTLDDLNEVDNRIVAAVEHSDDQAFRRELKALLDLVRTKGTPLPLDELHESDIVFPPSDLTMDEARHVFIGDGLISD